MRPAGVWPLLIAGCVACSSGPSAERLHDDCSMQPCAAGQTCLSYYGIAGPQGPLFKTCEIQCSADAVCPPPARCGATADGPPGNTCR